MSRRLSSTQRSRLTATVDNPYQGTTVTLPIRPDGYIHQKYYSQHPKDYRNQCTNPCRSGCTNVTANDTGVSDETFTDTNTYYDFCEPEDSISSRLPQYEYDEISAKRNSRNAFSDRSFIKKGTHYIKETKVNPVLVHKDIRRVYPNQENVCDRLYHEIDGQCSDPISMPIALPKRVLPLSRLSDRPQSSLSSGVGSAIVDGCGGRCQTFENVCYYFLQVAFTMGILIGTSLCIAGAVLRKSAARNLQVLVYIGAMLSLVSALLLGIQCNARNNARKRRKALRNAKRAPIPLNTLPTSVLPLQQQQQQPLMVTEDCSQRSLPVTHNFISVAAFNQSRRLSSNPVVDQQGIPWWRRKDLNK